MPFKKLRLGVQYRPWPEKLLDLAPKLTPTINHAFGETRLHTFITSFWQSIYSQKDFVTRLSLDEGRVPELWNTNVGFLGLVHDIMNAMLPAVRVVLQKESVTVRDLLTLPSVTDQWPSTGLTVYITLWPLPDLNNEDVTKCEIYVGQTCKSAYRLEKSNSEIIGGKGFDPIHVQRYSPTQRRVMIPIMYWKESVAEDHPYTLAQLAKQTVLSLFDSYHPICRRDPKKPNIGEGIDLVRWHVPRAYFLRGIAQELKRSLRWTFPTTGGRNLSSPLFQSDEERKMYIFDSEPSLDSNDRGFTEYRTSVRFRRSNDSGMRGALIARLDTYQGAENSWLFQIPPEAVMGLKLPSFVDGYLVFEIMDGDQAHEKPYFGCPNIGPFEDFGRPSSLAIRFEWLNVSDNCWYKLPLALLQDPTYSPGPSQTIKLNDLLDKWHSIMDLIQLLEHTMYPEYTADFPGLQDAFTFPNSISFSDVSRVRMNVDHLQQTVSFTKEGARHCEAPAKSKWKDNVDLTNRQFRSTDTVVCLSYSPLPRKQESCRWTPPKKRWNKFGTSDESDTRNEANMRHEPDIRVPFEIIHEPDDGDEFDTSDESNAGDTFNTSPGCCDFCALSRLSGCDRERTRKDVSICKSCHLMNRPCTFTPVWSALERWGTGGEKLFGSEPSRPPLSMYPSGPLRSVAFYQALTLEERTTAVRITPPVEGLGYIAELEGRGEDED